MGEAPHALSAVVSAIGERFALVEGQPRLSDDDLHTSWNELRTVPLEQRFETVSELVALAIKFQRLGGAAATQAVAQLYVLAGELLGDVARAASLFESQGVDLSGAAKLIGVDTTKRPVGTSKLSEGGNLFALLKGSAADRKKK